MTSRPTPIAVEAESVERTSLQIPGTTPNGLEVQLLNLNASHGVVATIIHFEAGASVPAHFHENGSEAHYVLEGDLVDEGRSFGPGSYLTHAAGVVHGPHSSVNGCRVLTVRSADFGPDDHHLVNDASVASDANFEATKPLPEGVPSSEVPIADKSAATSDNPTNPNSG